MTAGLPEMGPDPAKGSPAAVRDIAAMFRARAQVARDDAAHMRGASNALTGTVAVSVDDVRPRIVALQGKFAELGAADDEVALILDDYADGVEHIIRRATSLRAECDEAWTSLWARRSESLGQVQEFLLGWTIAWDETVSVGLSFGGGEAPYLDTGRWRGAIDDFTAARDAYRLLADERDGLDSEVAARLTRVELFAALTDGGSVGIGGVGAVVDAWSGDASAVTARSLTAVGDPRLVRTVWDSLTEAQRRRLILSDPALLGNLPGLPPSARVLANQLNAQERLRVIDRILASEPHPYHPRSDDEIAKLEAEKTYLTDAVAGKFGLYYYDQSTDSIVEMIGSIGPDTSEINTYVPGTFTSALSVYRGEVQQVGDWLSEQDPGVVTFVWKMGAFPGENAISGVADIARVFEANDVGFTLGKGEDIAGFQDELHVAVGDTAADFNAIGHSWGLAAITSSEVAGAHYDSVVSLAGAGMPPGWEASAGTNYSHYSYTDVLSMAQATGTVWDGRVPGDDPAFESRIYEREGDFTLVVQPYVSPGGVSVPVPAAPPAEISATIRLLENHNLIATSVDENLRALNDLLRGVRR